MGILDIFKKNPVFEINVLDLEDIDDKYYYNGALFSGRMNEYYESGKIAATVMCKSGEMISPLKEFYESGAIKKIRKFHKDDMVAETGYFENGNLEFEIEYSNGRKVRRIDYYPSGKVQKIKPYKFVERYNDDVPHGIETFYNENGDKISEAIWKNGMPDGSFDLY